jgi:heme-degrading monooxygenase HmoA
MQKMNTKIKVIKFLSMIERHWKGVAKFEEADNYSKHLLEDTFPKLKTIPGFIRGVILKRTIADGIEFIIITIWESFESIKQFTGEQIATAVVPDLVKNMMHKFDTQVAHYDVVNTTDRNLI